TLEYLQLAVAPEGPITIVYRKMVHYDQAVYTLVSTDGGESFEGPYKQTPRDNAGLSPRQCVRVGRDGLIHAIWYEKWKPGYYVDPTYAESRDYGRTFPRRDHIADQSTYPGGSYPALAVTPDGVKCMIDSAWYYTQCRW
ncbi:MAG: sialidase family protein, partial [Planctomycetota bacterium]